MADLQAIAYLSRTTHEFLQDEIDRLLLTARKFNEQHEITGVLLSNSSLFFQYFEGSPTNVDVLFERIKKDNRHKILIEVFNAPLPKRYFDQWLMGFCRAPNGCIQELAQISWAEKSIQINNVQTESEGLQMLMKFWNNLAVKA